MSSTLVDLAKLLNDRGEGAVFTMAEIAEVLGIDEEFALRRKNDLTPLGWKIVSYKDDSSLQPRQFRLVKIGTHVWEAGQRRSPTRTIKVDDIGIENLTPDQRRRLAQLVAASAPPEPDPVQVAYEKYMRLSERNQQRLKVRLFPYLINADGENA